MGRGRLSNEEIKALQQNPYVVEVNEKRIIYAEDFKKRFIKEYMAGKGPTQIFIDAGFDPAMLGSKRIERACFRWKELFAAGALDKKK